MTVHELKTWPEPFQHVWDRRKLFEIRENDRNFSAGDLLVLREQRPVTVRAAMYTGRTIVAEIVHVECGTWGLPVTLAVLGLDFIARLGTSERRVFRG